MSAHEHAHSPSPTTRVKQEATHDGGAADAPHLAVPEAGVSRVDALMTAGGNLGMVQLSQSDGAVPASAGRQVQREAAPTQGATPAQEAQGPTTARPAAGAAPRAVVMNDKVDVRTELHHAAIHVVRSMAATGHPRLRITVEGDSGPTVSVDYIKGFTHAIDLVDGSPEMPSPRGGLMVVALGHIEQALGTLREMATTGEVRLPPDQANALMDMAYALKLEIVDWFHSKAIATARGRAIPTDENARRAWEARVYQGQLDRDEKAKGAETAAVSTSITGDTDVMSTAPVPKRKSQPAAEAAPVEETTTPPTKEPVEPELVVPADPIRIYFGRNEAVANMGPLAQLEPFCKKDHPLEAVGHASAEGPATYNLSLSKKRAATVASELARLGAKRVEAGGVGEEGAQSSEGEKDPKKREELRAKWRFVDVMVSDRPAAG